MKMPRSKKLIPVVIGCTTLSVLVPLTSFAQVIALDTAANYSGTWPSPAPNNGFGFGAWSFNNTTPNGGFSGEFLGSSGGIDTGGNSFGFYANNAANAQSQAVRAFGQTLTSYQTFSIQMQNGNVTDNGGQVGVFLRDSSQNNIFGFSFLGGGANYQLSIGQSPSSSVTVNTGVGFTSGAMTLSFTELAGDAWSFSITTGSGTTTLTSSGTGVSLYENDISQVQILDQNGGSSRTLGDNGNFYVNSPEVVPEPATISLLGVSLVTGLVFYRRQRR